MSATCPGRKPRCDRHPRACGADGRRSERRSKGRGHRRRDGRNRGESFGGRSKAARTVRVPHTPSPLMPVLAASTSTGRRARKVDPPLARRLASALMSRLAASTRTGPRTEKVAPLVSRPAAPVVSRIAASTTTVRRAASVDPRGERIAHGAGRLVVLSPRPHPPPACRLGGRRLGPFHGRGGRPRHPMAARVEKPMSDRPGKASGKPEKASGWCPAGPFSCPQMHATSPPAGHVRKSDSACQSRIGRT